MVAGASKPVDINTESAIPEKLRLLPRWKVTNGKNPGHGWNIDANLKTYDKAVELARRAGADEVIYIVGETDPFTFVDLDGVRDPQTGHIEPWAQEIIDELDSYTEASSSGEGVHIIVEAEKPGPRCKIQNYPDFEIYDDVRPALITGDRINDKDIEPRQGQIEALYTRILPERTATPVDVEPTGLSNDEVLEWVLQRDKNAPKFRTVYNGEWGEHYPSKSEADFGLASKLLSYSGDPDQVEELMLNSGLYHEKYDSMRGPVTYLRQTIDNALDRLEWLYEPGKGLLTVGKRRRQGRLSGWVDLAAVAAGGIKPVPQIIPNQVYEGIIHLIHSKPGVGKTLLAIYQAKQALDAGLTVMYLDAENGVPMFVERAQGLGIENFSRLHYNPSPEPSLDSSWIADFLADVDHMKPSIVFIDSFADFLAACGLDENSSMDVTKFHADILQPLREQGIAVVILDHEPWESRGHARGSTAKLAKMDVEWELRQTLPFDRESVGEITLNLKKDRPAYLKDRVIKYSVGGPDLKFEQSAGTVADDGLVLATKAMKHTRDAIKGFGAAGATDSEWRAATIELGTGQTQYYSAKRSLLESGWVVKNNDTRRFIYSGSQTEVTEAERTSVGAEVANTVSAEGRMNTRESNSAEVKPKYAEVPSIYNSGHTPVYRTGVNRSNGAKRVQTEDVSGPGGVETEETPLSNGFREFYAALTDSGVDLTPQHFFALVEPHMAELPPDKAWTAALTGDPKAMSWSADDLQRAIERLGG